VPKNESLEGTSNNSHFSSDDKSVVVSGGLRA
jgi:hypothetical protein